MSDIQTPTYSIVPDTNPLKTSSHELRVVKRILRTHPKHGYILHIVVVSSGRMRGRLQGRQMVRLSRLRLRLCRAQAAGLHRRVKHALV